VVSTVAGLASLVSYPVLLAFGLPPLSANVTNTVALVFTGAGAAAGSRPELAGQGRRVRRLGMLTALGGAAGAAVLLLTPPGGFVAAAPALIGVSALVLLAQPLTRRRSGAGRSGADGAPSGDGQGGADGPASGDGQGRTAGGNGPDGDGRRAAGNSGRERAGRERSLPLQAAVFCVAIYIGYFGAAGGILLLAALAGMLDQSLARTNAVKNVVSGLANAVAAVAFAVFGPVRWAFVAPLAAGFLVGGWVGPSIVRRLPEQLLRLIVGAAGLIIAVKLGVSAYR
jgi:uncharacterized membrane protein YfcA